MLHLKRRANVEELMIPEQDLGHTNQTVSYVSVYSREDRPHKYVQHIKSAVALSCENRQLATNFVCTAEAEKG